MKNVENLRGVKEYLEKRCTFGDQNLPELTQESHGQIAYLTPRPNHRPQT